MNPRKPQNPGKIPRISSIAIGDVPLPPYRRHKGSGQGYTTIKGKRYYFGKHDLPESRQAYLRFVAECRRPPNGR